MRQIAGLAELSVGKLYHHFKGKEEIFREILEKYIEEFHAKIEGAGNPDDPPLRRLRCIIEAVTEHLKERRLFALIYLNENPLILGGILKDKDRIRETIVGLFSEAIENGDIPETDPRMLSGIFIGAVHGLLHMVVESDEEGAFDTVPAVLDRIILKPLETGERDTSGMEGS